MPALTLFGEDAGDVRGQRRGRRERAKPVPALAITTSRLPAFSLMLSLTSAASSWSPDLSCVTKSVVG